MLEFQLDTGSAAQSFAALDSFTQGYIEAAFFTECNDLYDSDEWESDQAQEDIREGRCGGEIPRDSSVSDLAPETLARITADCAAFQAAAADLLNQAYEETAYSPEQAGRDFWLTRNGHGVGFWDREELDWFSAGDNAVKLGDALDALCCRQAGFPEVDLYRGDDSLIYLA